MDTFKPLELIILSHLVFTGERRPFVFLLFLLHTLLRRPVWCQITGSPQWSLSFCFVKKGIQHLIERGHRTQAIRFCLIIFIWKGFEDLMCFTFQHILFFLALTGQAALSTSIVYWSLKYLSGFFSGANLSVWKHIAYPSPLLWNLGWLLQ